jgi:hypothetical protein
MANLLRASSRAVCLKSTAAHGALPESLQYKLGEWIERSQIG